jgi:hypothetical protein
MVYSDKSLLSFFVFVTAKSLNVSVPSSEVKLVVPPPLTKSARV